MRSCTGLESLEEGSREKSCTLISLKFEPKSVLGQPCTTPHLCERKVRQTYEGGVIFIVWKRHHSIILAITSTAHVSLREDSRFESIVTCPQWSNLQALLNKPSWSAATSSLLKYYTRYRLSGLRPLSKPRLRWLKSILLQRMKQY